LTDFANAIWCTTGKLIFRKRYSWRKALYFMQEIYLHLMFGLLNHKIKLEYCNGTGKLGLQVQEGTLGTKEISCAESSCIKASSDYAAVS